VLSVSGESVQVDQLSVIMQSLVHLDLSFNCITSIQPLQTLSRLHVLLASDNQLASLKGVGGCKSLNRLDVHANRIMMLSDVADAAQCPLLGTLNLSQNPAQKCMEYRLHIVFLLPQVTNLDSLLVDEKEKVHAQNLHGGDAEGLKRTRDYYFPHGELDDGGGAIPPIAAGLLPDHGSGTIPNSSGPEDFARIDTLVDALPLSAMAEGVLAFGDILQVRLSLYCDLAYSHA
jgi:Leucine-rich repeat